MVGIQDFSRQAIHLSVLIRYDNAPGVFVIDPDNPFVTGINRRTTCFCFEQL
jgi:hypothetical protein